MEDDLWWKTTFDGRWPLIEDVESKEDEDYSFANGAICLSFRWVHYSCLPTGRIRKLLYYKQCDQENLQEKLRRKGNLTGSDDYSTRDIEEINVDIVTKLLSVRQPCWIKRSKEKNQSPRGRAAGTLREPGRVNRIIDTSGVDFLVRVLAWLNMWSFLSVRPSVCSS